MLEGKQSGLPLNTKPIMLFLKNSEGLMSGGTCILPKEARFTKEGFIVRAVH